MKRKPITWTQCPSVMTGGKRWFYSRVVAGRRQWIVFDRRRLQYACQIEQAPSTPPPFDTRSLYKTIAHVRTIAQGKRHMETI